MIDHEDVCPCSGLAEPCSAAAAWQYVEDVAGLALVPEDEDDEIFLYRLAEVIEHALQIERRARS